MLNNVCYDGGVRIELVRRSDQPRAIPKNYRDLRPERFQGFGWEFTFRDIVVDDPAR